jgi:putative acetyltransferase
LWRCSTPAFAELVSRYGADGRSQVHTNARFLVAVLDDQAVGCGAPQPSGEPGIAELKRMYVMPEFRGRGIASAVLGSLEVPAAQLGYDALRLATGTRQPGAIALYESRGYSQGEPYGKYVGEALSRCYHKQLARTTAMPPPNNTKLTNKTPDNPDGVINSHRVQ